MATSPSPNDLTRQQLDELDSLLQRMLALPLNQPDHTPNYPPPPPLPEIAPPPVRQQSVPSWRADPPARAPQKVQPQTVSEPVLTPSFRSLPTKPEAPAPAPVVAPQIRIFNPPAPTPATDFNPPGGPGTLRGVDAPALPPDYRPVSEPFNSSAFSHLDLADVNPFATLAPSPLMDTEPATVRKPVPMLLWPVFGVNAILEFVLGWFGPLGHFLTRPAVKVTLGWLGAILLLAAGWWSARGMGWVSWPR